MTQFAWATFYDKFSTWALNLEVEGQTGAGHGESTPDRLTQRNGCRDRISSRSDWSKWAPDLSGEYPGRPE